MRKMILLLGAIALVSLASCSTQIAEPDAPADFCADLQAFGEALVSIEAADANSAVDDIRQAQQAAAVHHSQLLQAAGALDQVRPDVIEAAWQELVDTVSALPEGEKLEEAAGNVLASAAALRTAYADLARALCVELTLADDEDALVPVQVEPAASAGQEEPVAETVAGQEESIAGIYASQTPATNGSQQKLTLALHPDNTASLVFHSGVAQDSAEATPAETILVGTWAESSDGAIAVTLDRLLSGEVLAVAESFLLEREAGQLRALEYDQQAYGSAGLTFQRAEATSQPEAVASQPEQQAAAEDQPGDQQAAEDEATAPPAAETPLGVEAGNLAGTAWQLQQIQQAGGALISIDNPARYTLAFLPDGAVQAIADCNQGVGTFQAAEGSIELRIDWSKLICPQPTLDRQFSKYLDYADTYVWSGETLVLSYSNGSGTLTFGPANQ